MVRASMKALITGGAGFIGSHVADAYLRAGHRVVVVDNLSTGSRDKVPDGASFYLLDIGSAEIQRLFELEKPDIVNHHAAQISVTVSARDPQADARTNAVGFLNLLETCARRKIRKLLYSSTGGAIYGETEVLPTPEEHPDQPVSPYGIHKLLGEQYLRFYSLQHGLDYTVLRYANVYGPRQNPLGEAGVISIFVNQLLKGEQPTLFAYPEEPDGMLRDYVYVEDVAQANLRALETGSGECLNIGTGVSTSTGALYRELAALFPGAPEIRRAPARPGDLRRSCLAIARAKRVLDWGPSVDLHEGLSRTVAFFS
jgi:UDP-glucose 4-epimerase